MTWSRPRMEASAGAILEPPCTGSRCDNHEPCAMPDRGFGWYACPCDGPRQASTVTKTAFGRRSVHAVCASGTDIRSPDPIAPGRALDEPGRRLHNLAASRTLRLGLAEHGAMKRLIFGIALVI